MRLLLILLLLSSVAAAQEWTDYQKGVAEGLKIGFFMNQKYVDAQDGINVTGYNTEVQRYNAWVISIFGNDPQFMMNPITAPSNVSDLSKPVLISNVTSPGIVHEIDGGTKAKSPAYTTNDMNLLRDPGNMTQIQKEGGAWLGGV